MSEMQRFYANRRVLVTGHTGFMGCWLTSWLREMGVDVVGISLDPPTEPSMAALLGITGSVPSAHVDVRNEQAVLSTFTNQNPEIVFHLAGQATVGRSFLDPLTTFSTNFMGTAHVLDAARRTRSVRVVVVATSDKCYQEAAVPRRESDALGPRNALGPGSPLGPASPYSASKAATEHLVTSYRNLQWKVSDHDRIGFASARAGNAFGGGDWACGRLVPDVIRSLDRGLPIELRQPKSVRPWQHVLEPLHGYLRLGHALTIDPEKFSRPFNFGPTPHSNITSRELANMISKHWGATLATRSAAKVEFPEDPYLAIDSSEAETQLEWQQTWNLETAVEQTVAWYKCFRTDPGLLADLTRSQLAAFEKDTESFASKVKPDQESANHADAN